MEPDYNSDELLEEQPQQDNGTGKDTAPSISPVRGSKEKEGSKSSGLKKLTGKNANQAGGGIGGKGKQAAQSGAKGVAKKSLDKTVTRGTAGKSTSEKLVNKGLSTAAKAIPYVGQAVSVAVKKIGVKRLSLIVFGIMMIPSMLVLTLVFLVTTIHEAPRAVMGYAWDKAKESIGLNINASIKSGASSKLAYEYEIRTGTSTSVAAPDGAKPEEGTLAFKYASIDWEKAKYQTVEIDSNCEVKTKEVKSAIDGSQRSVIDKVVFKRSGKDALNRAIANRCIEQSYPIFNTIMRSRFLREGINKELGVRYAYAEPEDSKSLEGKSQDDIDKVLREKTLKRVWNVNLKNSVNNDTANQQASNQAAVDQASASGIVEDVDDNTKKIEGAIERRAELKKPCDPNSTSIAACESQLGSKAIDIFNLNVNIISVLENKYRDKIPKKGGTNGDYYFWLNEVNEKCKPIAGAESPCTIRQHLNNAADRYAESLVDYYNGDISQAKEAPAATPATPAPAPPPDPTSGWPTTCQKDFKPTQEDPVDKAIANAVNDLLCGMNPKNITLKDIELPKEERGADPGIASDDLTTASLKILCQFTTRLLTNDSYKDVVRYRIASAANAAWQTVTYADTTRNRFIKLSESSGDFYKIGGFQASQEYNVPVNSSMVGEPLEQIAIGDAIGAQRTFTLAGTGLDKGTGDKIYKQFVADTGICQDLIKSGGNVASRGSIEEKLQQIHFPGWQNIPTGSRLNYHYKHEYQDLKKAIAALPYYTQKEPDIEKTARDLLLGDVLLYLVKTRANISDTGTEDAPQNFNRMSLGMKAYMNAQSLATGGQFLRTEQSIALENQIETARRADEKGRGIAYRLFGRDNPRSLASRLAAAATDYPVKAAGNVASTMINLFNPIDMLVSSRKSVAYYLTGETNVALASNDYDRNNLRLDPAGLTNEMLATDPLKNAGEIEKIKKDGGYQMQFFSTWDGCFKKFIPTQELHLQEDNPDCIILFTSISKLQKDYGYSDFINLAKQEDLSFLKPIADKLEESAKSDSSIKDRTVWPYQLGVKYRLYHFSNLQADALIYLSDPDKEDESLNAASSSASSADAGSTGGTGPNPNVAVDKSSSCSGGPKPGTQQMADFVMQKFGTSSSGIYNCRTVRGGSSMSLHAEGRAFDAAISASNPEEKARGDQLFMWAMTNAANLGLQEIIWNRQIWTPSKGLHPYGGSNPHTDHVHLGQNNAGAAGQTAFYTSGAGKN